MRVEGFTMAATNESDRRYIQGARLVTTLDASDLEVVFELIGQGQQVLVVIPSNMPRGDYDALTERLIDVADRGDAMISAIQVGSARPRGWRRWLSRLNATRSFIVTPKVLGDPSVLVTWLPEAETGAERLVVGELHTFRTGSKHS
jgi:hypothetical protein